MIWVAEIMIESVVTYKRLFGKGNKFSWPMLEILLRNLRSNYIFIGLIVMQQMRNHMINFGLEDLLVQRTNALACLISRSEIHEEICVPAGKVTTYISFSKR